MEQRDDVVAAGTVADSDEAQRQWREEWQRESQRQLWRAQRRDSGRKALWWLLIACGLFLLFKALALCAC